MRDEFEGFYRAQMRAVYAAAFAATADPGAAEDLTQETLLRAWRHFGAVRSLCPPAQRGWLLRTLRNLHIDRCRARKTTATPEDLEGAAAARDGTATAPMRLDVARALAALDATDRDIVVLRYFCEMNSREIGEALAMPESSVRRRLAESRARLAEHLAGWEVG